jgi:hypothetical protein
MKYVGERMWPICVVFDAMVVELFGGALPMCVPMLMALNMATIYVWQKGVKACTLEAELSIKVSLFFPGLSSAEVCFQKQKLPVSFIWRYMFYQAFDRKVAKMLGKVIVQNRGQEDPVVANTTLETGESRV